MYDLSLITDYRRDLGDDFVVEIIDTFLDSAPNNFNTIEKSLLSGDCELFTRMAHNLKGNAKTFGATKMADLCFQMEQKGKDCKLEELNGYLENAKIEFKKLESFLINFKKELIP